MNKVARVSRPEPHEAPLSEAELLALEAQYCSHGDTVHYTDPPKIFEECEGSFLYDMRGPALSRPADVVLGRQFRLPQRAPEQRRAPPARPAAPGRQPIPASREDRARRPHRAGRGEEVRRQGPRAFQRRRQPGGGGQPQARAQRQERQEPDVRLRGRLPRPHARRLGHHLVLSLSPPLRPLRRSRPLRALPLPLPRAQGHEQGGIRPPLRQAVRAPVRERVQRRLGPQGRTGGVRRLLRRADPGHRRLRDPAEELLHRAEEGARQARHPARRRRDPDGLLPHRQAVVDRALRRHARHRRVRQGDHQRPQSAGRHLGEGGADQSRPSSRPAPRIRPSTPIPWARPWRWKPCA